MRHAVIRVTPVEVTDDAAVLHVTDTLSGYEVREADGALVQRVPGRSEAGFRVELARTASGWRLVQVTPER